MRNMTFIFKNLGVWIDMGNTKNYHRLKNIHQEGRHCTIFWHGLVSFTKRSRSLYERQRLTANSMYKGPRDPPGRNNVVA